MTERRGLTAALGALIAFGAGLMAYRWFVLGFGWSGDRSTAIMVVSIAAMITGAQAPRLGGDFKKVPWWLRLAAALPGLAIGAGVGFLIAPTAGHVALHDREAGNVTLGLPSGEETTQDGIVGKILIKRAGGFESIVGVTWQAGTLDDATMQALTSALAAGLQGQAQVVAKDDLVVGDGLPHRAATMSKDGDSGWITMFTCGDRIVGVYAFGHAAEAFERRVLATVRCRAKPGDAPAQVPARFDAPTGWTAQATEPGQLAWASADAALLIRPIESADPDGVEKVFAAIGPAMGGQIHLGAKRADGTRTLWTGSISSDGQDMAALIALWACPGQGALLAMYLHAPGSDEAPGIDVLHRVRCGS
jgi:hypothetical protein